VTKHPSKREEKLCPRCGQPCMGVFRRYVLNPQGKKYYYLYAAHYGGGHKVKWCYVGRSDGRVRRTRQRKVGAERHDAK
jgi:hypothetical protein